MNMPSKKVIFLVLILAIFLIGFIIFYVSFVSSKTISARLLVENEKVFVNGEEVSGSYILDEKDEISVSGTGSAAIILYESVIVILDPNTLVVVENLVKKYPKLSQEEGGTWNQFTKLAGVEAYEIRTSTSVASVRGTGFYLNSSLIFVGEGEVDYDFNDQSFVVEKGKAIEKFGEFIKERDMTPEELEKVKVKKLEVINILEKLRIFELEKHQKMLNFLKDRYQFTDEDISTYLEKADRGEVNLENLRKKSPIGLDSLEKIIEITNKIKEISSSISFSR